MSNWKTSATAPPGTATGWSRSGSVGAALASGACKAFSGRAGLAVDLLAAQLQHHEYGVPPVPRQILIPPGFVEGGSLRGA
jgi:hypothetical protein